jgi:hypothetical protein
MKTKKLNLSSLIVVAGLLFFVSCKKNYTCTCVQTYNAPAYTYNGVDHPADIRINTFTNTFKSTKKDSESGCKMGESIHSYPSTYEAQGQGPTVETVTCELI